MLKKFIPLILSFGASLIVLLTASCAANIPAQLGDNMDELIDVSLPDRGPAPELAGDTWLNTDQPLRLADLKGKVVLLDMWTFG